jgi:hypothetical protein
MAHIVGGVAVAAVGLVPIALLVEADRIGSAAVAWVVMMALIWVVT